MDRGQVAYCVLSTGLILTFASVTYASPSMTTVTEDRSTDAVVVDSTAGLLDVSQTADQVNLTTETADVAVTVTNRLSTTIDEVRVSAGGTTMSTKRLAPGERDTVRFDTISCTATITATFTDGSLHARWHTAIDCS